MANFPIRIPINYSKDPIKWQIIKDAAPRIEEYINSNCPNEYNVFMYAAIANEAGLNISIVSDLLMSLDGSNHGITVYKKNN